MAMKQETPKQAPAPRTDTKVVPPQEAPKDEPTKVVPPQDPGIGTGDMAQVPPYQK